MEEKSGAGGSDGDALGSQLGSAGHTKPYGGAGPRIENIALARHEPDAGSETSGVFRDSKRRRGVLRAFGAGQRESPVASNVDACGTDGFGVLRSVERIWKRSVRIRAVQFADCAAKRRGRTL